MEKLPNECFLCPTGSEQIQAESDEQWIFERAECRPNEGTFIYFKGIKFPYKNFTSVEAVFAANQLKSIFIEAIKRFPLGIVFSNKQKLLDSFNRIGWKIMSPQLLKWQYLSDYSRALHFVIFKSLLNYGIKEETADKFATLFVHLIEFDNAYRLRLLDLCAETTKELVVKNPRKELKKILRIFTEREKTTYGSIESPNRVILSKVKSIGRILGWLIYLPKVRKAVTEAIWESDFEKLQADEGDRYWSCMRKDYHFLGLTYEERQNYAKERGWTFPQKI